MKPRKLTPEQVEMLIEDGTLQPEDLMEKKTPMQLPQKYTDQNEATIHMMNELSYLSEHQNTALNANYFNKYQYLVNMIQYGIPIENVNQLYLVRNLLIGRYKDFVKNILYETEHLILNDIRKKYPKLYFRWSIPDENLNKGVFNDFKEKLSDLNFMNWFGLDMDTPISIPLIQGFIESLSYKISVVADMEENTDIDIGRVVYSYYNDISIMLNYIITAAYFSLITLGNYDTNKIPAELATQIVQPKQFDLTEPITSFYNDTYGFSHCEDDNAPKKRLYTIVE